MSENSVVTEDKAHKHHNSSSNRVLRTIIFVLTPFLMLVITGCICVLALSKPYASIKAYANIIFKASSTDTTAVRTENKYRDDDAPVLSREVTDEETEETHTMIYPYYGDYYAWLNIESIGFEDVPVYSGTTNDVLANGAGWFNGSVYIGNVGNVVLAGHNHTYFYGLWNCTEGDIVTLETEYCKLTYVVRELIVFHEDDETYIRPTEEDILTMYTCWNNGKLGMSEYRIAVICDLTEREWKEVEQ